MDAIQKHREIRQSVGRDCEWAFLHFCGDRLDLNAIIRDSVLSSLRFYEINGSSH